VSVIDPRVRPNDLAQAPAALVQAEQTGSVLTHRGSTLEPRSEDSARNRSWAHPGSLHLPMCAHLEPGYGTGWKGDENGPGRKIGSSDRPLPGVEALDLYVVIAFAISGQRRCRRDHSKGELKRTVVLVRLARRS
jgi:hypothetical protein